jgi:4-amino-4-deoxy-L-arabinose transferase-like glycosyltransferase
MIVCLGALYGFTGFFERWQTGAPNPYRLLFLGAFFLGLAGLAKFNAALLGLGLVAYILADRRKWPLLRDPKLYLAALLALALQAPVVLWNVQHGFASLHFNHGCPASGGRKSGLDGGRLGFPAWRPGIHFAVHAAAAVPVVLWP